MTHQDSNTTKPIKDYQFIHQIAQLAFVEKIILFGSRARVDNNPRSDIDIAISCPNANNKDWLKILEIVDSADTLLKIDCVNLNTADHDLQKKIEKEGIILYEKK